MRLIYHLHTTACALRLHSGTAFLHLQRYSFEENNVSLIGKFHSNVTGTAISYNVDEFHLMKHMVSHKSNE
jgi:hypothetical protein